MLTDLLTAPPSPTDDWLLTLILCELRAPGNRKSQMI
jgi:hypothetical protein